MAYQAPPPQPGAQTLPALFQHARQVASAVDIAIGGGLNVIGTVTLAAGAATTTINDARLSYQSAVLLMPMTANAAGALATTWFNGQNTGVVVVNHMNAVSTDRTFRYVILA